MLVDRSKKVPKTAEIQESIDEAIKEFAEYERLSDPFRRIKYIINRIKFAYAENLFKSLSEIEFKDMFVWMHYLPATASVKEEREIIFREGPELGKVFTQFGNIYIDELQEFLT